MKQRNGILVLIGLVAAFLLLRRFVPALAKLFLILSWIAAAGVLLLVAAVIFFAFHKPKKTPEQELAEQAAAVLQDGRSRLMELRRLSMKIKEPRIRTVSESICSTIDKILRTLKDQPEDIAPVGRFFHYYLPTLQSILTKYTRLENGGISTEETAEKTLSCLKDMKSAMGKQYQNLFENDKLDLAVEMTVLTQICRQDGLLADDYQLPDLSALSAEATENDQEQGITLTL